MTGEGVAPDDGGPRRSRRQRRLIGGVAACLVAAAGLPFLISRDGEPDEIAGAVPPTPPPTERSTSAPNTSVAVTDAATSTSSVGESTSVATAPIATAVATTDAASTTVPLATPPPVTYAPPAECDPEAVLTVGSIRFETTRDVPSRGQGFLVQSTAPYASQTLELWSEAGRAAVISDTVPDFEVSRWCPTLPMPLDYDGRWIWFWSGGYPLCGWDCTVARSELFRADVASGDVVSMWDSDLGENVLDLLPDGVGGATIVTGPAPGKQSVAIEVVGADGRREVVASWPTASPAVLSAELQQSSGRVAFTTIGPTAVHVVQVGSDTELTTDLEDLMFWPVVRGWQPGGDRLLIEHAWENGWVAVIDVGVENARTTFTQLDDYACWMGDGVLARGGWDTGYGEADWYTGSVTLIDESGATITDYGLDVMAGPLACLDDGRVAFASYTQLPDGTSPPDSTVLSIAGPDGSVIELARESVWVHWKDAVG